MTGLKKPNKKVNIFSMSTTSKVLIANVIRLYDFELDGCTQQ